MIPKLILSTHIKALRAKFDHDNVHNTAEYPNAYETVELPVLDWHTPSNIPTANYLHLYQKNSAFKWDVESMTEKE
jgi:hypothetical protein